MKYFFKNNLFLYLNYQSTLNDLRNIILCYNLRRYVVVVLQEPPYDFDYKHQQSNGDGGGNLSIRNSGRIILSLLKAIK